MATTDRALGTWSGTAVFTESDVFCGIVSVAFEAESDDLTVQIMGNRFYLGGICVDDQCAILGQQLCKTMEGMPDIVNIFKEIQMIRVHVQHDGDLREKAYETVGIFAGFGDEGIGVPQTKVAADLGKDTADTDRRIHTSLHEH